MTAMLGTCGCCTDTMYELQFNSEFPDFSGSTSFPGGAPYSTNYAALFAVFTKFTNLSNEYLDLLELFPTSPLWGAFPPTTDFTLQGWTLFGSIPTAPQMGISMGLAKNTSGTNQTYSILRVRLGSNFLGGVFGSPTITSGVTTTTAIIEIYATGTILPGQVIGFDAAATSGGIDLPFPSTQPSDEIEIGNNTLIDDLYFAVIGMNPTDFLTFLNVNYFDPTFGPPFVVGTNSQAIP